MGLRATLAKSCKNNIARGKYLKEPISFQGDLTDNNTMSIAFKRVLKNRRHNYF